MIGTLTIVGAVRGNTEGERMGATGELAGILLAVAVGVALVILRWAAVVRGGIHRQCVRRSRTLHVTMSAVAGCGMA
jgi:hypothetical protein